LYAPYDGQIAAVAVQPGAAVEAFKPVLSVMDPREREIRVDSVVSTDLQRLSAKQPVTLRFSRYPDQPAKGVVERLPGGGAGAGGAPADPSLHISYDPGKLDLDIGDLAQVIVTLQRKEKVLWLPPQAIRTFQGRRFVVIEGEGGRQRRVDVKLGIEAADKVEIVEGLKEGQKVIGQ
jgi:multidrug efflux pump subunit AcrA (membrane-fusion protein)